MTSRLAEVVATPFVLISECDEDADFDTLRHEVAQAQISILVAPPEPPSDTSPLETLRRRLESHGLVPEFVGHLREDDARPSGWTVAILRGVAPPSIGPAPADFRVVAIMHAYNEEDVIEPVIGHLAHNGVGVYLIDNWSTDSTPDRARTFEGRGLVGYERFPPHEPSTSFELKRLLTRTEEVAAEIDATWVMHNDADEFRSAPWPGVTLRDALFHVQTEGFSVVDHGCLNFALTEDGYDTGALEEYLQWFLAERTPDLFRLNCWRRLPGAPAELAWSGGHSVRFPGTKVFPYNFLIRHFPIRSVEQGQRKIFRERLSRYPVGERLEGWHSHYDHIRAETLVRPTNGLVHLEPSFNEDFIVERLTGVGWEPLPGPVTLKIRVARVLRRLGLLDKALSFRWRHGGRATKDKP
jgi:hypothetical protein